MIKIEIYTDGACNQQAKTGGWSFIMIEDGEIKIQKKGPEIETTNNKCEMIAVIKALEELESKEFFGPISVTVYSDSAYLVNGFLEDWITGWMKNGWLNAYNKPVKNKELWEKLIYLQKKYRVIFNQIKRMSNDLAKRVDQMAKSA